MLYAFAFQRFGVLVSDLFIVDPDPLPGQESAERGVRLEIRLIEAGDLKGSIYSARPIEVGRPIWRADLLEDAAGPPGTLDRAHHHPAFRGWEPGARVFDPALLADPVGWVGEQLGDLEGIAKRAGLAAGSATAVDASELRRCVPEIMAAVRNLLDRVQAGELAAAPGGGQVASARVSWL